LAHLWPASACFFLGFIFGPEDGGNMSLRKKVPSLNNTLLCTFSCSKSKLFLPCSTYSSSLKMESVNSSETSANLYQIIHRHSPEDNVLCDIHFITAPEIRRCFRNQDSLDSEHIVTEDSSKAPGQQYSSNRRATSSSYHNLLWYSACPPAQSIKHPLPPEVLSQPG
jgi:hypothetical protein